jgi:hypothetical protein
MTLTKTQNQLVGEVASFIAQGIECWQKAGEIIVRLLDDHQMTVAAIAEKSEYLTEDIVCRFEQLGRKQILPRLLIAEYPAARHLVRLPYSEQKRALDESVELLVMEDNKPTTLRVAVENLTPQQCRQVFNGGHIRSIGAQRAYVQEKKSEEEITTAIKQVHELYKVRGRRVVFLQPCEMTARQLANIIAEIEG